MTETIDIIKRVIKEAVLREQDTIGNRLRNEPYQGKYGKLNFTGRHEKVKKVVLPLQNPERKIKREIKRAIGKYDASKAGAQNPKENPLGVKAHDEKFRKM